MDSRRQARILLEVFEGEADIYPLHIIPTGTHAYGAGNDSTTKIFAGIHFAGTQTLLSVRQETPEFVSAAYNKRGELLEASCGTPAYILRSAELGNWIEALISSGDPLALEHCDIPFIFKDQAFTEFEQLAQAAISKYSCIVNGKRAKDAVNALSSVRTDPAVKGEIAFDGYYNMLQGIVIAQTGKIVHECAAFVDIAPEASTLYPIIVEKLRKSEQLSRREISIASHEIAELSETLEKSIHESTLSDGIEDEAAEALDKALLRFRQSYL